MASYTLPYSIKTELVTSITNILIQRRGRGFGLPSADPKWRPHPPIGTSYRFSHLFVALFIPVFFFVSLLFFYVRFLSLFLFHLVFFGRNFNFRFVLFSFARRFASEIYLGIISDFRRSIQHFSRSMVIISCSQPAINK